MDRTRFWCWYKYLGLGGKIVEVLLIIGRIILLIIWHIIDHEIGGRIVLALIFLIVGAFFIISNPDLAGVVIALAILGLWSYSKARRKVYEYLGS